MIKITCDEVLEYLGKNKPIFYSEKTLSEVVKNVNSSVKPKSTLKYFTPSFNENLTIIGDVAFKGKSLIKHLENTQKVALFCVTLGDDLDRLIEEYKYINLEASYLADLCGLILVEKLCDEIEETIKRGKKTTARFSIGFNDTDINQQSEFLKLLDATKKIGVNVTNGSMMLPTKSVTAIIGIYD